MLKNLFGTSKKTAKQEAAASTPITPVVPNRQYKPTKKKKNTYVLQLNTMTMPGAFELCPSTPLAVIKINGVETENAQGGFMSCTSFPNPGASTIQELYFKAPEWRIIMGAKASIIIEYLDKQSDKPVLMLFPNGQVQSLVAGEDINKVIGTRLNHTSRRDFVRQYNSIIDCVQIVNPLINIRNQAMQHAPRYSIDAFTQFVTELDRKQIERAHAIMAQHHK